MSGPGQTKTEAPRRRVFYGIVRLSFKSILRASPRHGHSNSAVTWSDATNGLTWARIGRSRLKRPAATVM
jgi:hypothetical protein